MGQDQDVHAVGPDVALSRGGRGAPRLVRRRGSHLCTARRRWWHGKARRGSDEIPSLQRLLLLYCSTVVSRGSRTLDPNS
jgi:hypothetical protein